MCVRSSTAFYGSFNLDMGRSPGFGYTHTDFCFRFRAINTWFPFGSNLLDLNLASKSNSPDRSTKSTRLMAISLPILTRFYAGETGYTRKFTQA